MNRYAIFEVKRSSYNERNQPIKKIRGVIYDFYNETSLSLKTSWKNEEIISYQCEKSILSQEGDQNLT